MGSLRSESGSLSYTLVMGEASGDTLQKVQFEAYVNAMVRFLESSRKVQVSSSSSETQRLVSSKYGKTVIRESNSYNQEEGHSKVEHLTTMDSKLSIQDYATRENSRWTRKLQVVQVGFPIFGTERILNLVRRGPNGTFVVKCILAIDNYWIEHQEFESSNP